MILGDEGVSWVAG